MLGLVGFSGSLPLYVIHRDYIFVFIDRANNDACLLACLLACLCCRKIYVPLCVRLSVCLSVTRRYSIETAKHIIKLFSPSGSQTLLVYPYQTVWQCSDGKFGNHANGGVKCRWYEKISIFDQ